MQIIKISLILLTLVSFLSFPQMNNNFAEAFISDLVNNNNVENYVLPEELSISQRLGISYDSVKYKYLISYDIDEEIKEQIKNGFKDYEIKVENAGNNFSFVKFSLTSQNYQKQFFFKDTFLISPILYYSKDWHKIETEYFIFLLSDKNLFNDYSAGILNKFIKEAAATLGFTGEEINILRKKKIYYFLCRDEKEINKLTGYESRGNYILAYDYIVTTYNCHFHEIVHLLMNYKLKNLPLYTHPFLQEGLAVALGGRGGLEAGVVLNLGKFLSLSGFMDYKQLLNAGEFKSIDPSMSYPLSGIYNLFLLKKNNIGNYIKMYRKYSGNGSYINNLVINDPDLPQQKEWLEFITNFTAPSIKPEYTEGIRDNIIKYEFCKLSKSNENYLFETNGKILISFNKKPGSFISKKFNEEFPGRKYNGEKYLLNVSASEISLYNLYTNNLLANYASGFSTDGKKVSLKGDMFVFTIPGILFEEDLKNSYITK